MTHSHTDEMARAVAAANRRAQQMGYSLQEHHSKVEQSEAPDGPIWRINYLPNTGGLRRRGGGCQIEVNSDGVIQQELRCQ